MSAFLQRHYHSVVLLCCFFILFTNQGLPATSFNVYQSYIVELPGVGSVGGSLVITVRAFVSLLTMFVVAAFYRRIDARYGVVGATLCTALGFTLYGAFPTLLGLCVGSVFTGIGYGIGGMVATTMILGRWFHGSLGKAAGFIGMGTGAASFIIPTAAATIIRQSNLSTAFFCEAGLAFCFAILFGLFLRSDPRQMGLLPHEKRQTHEHAQKMTAHCSKKSCRNLPHADMTKRERVLAMLAILLVGSMAITGYAYFSVLLTSAGIPSLTAAFITSVGGACLAFSKFACGWAFDRWGTRTGSLVFFALLTVGLILCTCVQGDNIPLAFAAGITFCSGMAIATTGIAIWSLELSSPATSMRTVRDFNLAYAAGGFIFNMMPGPLHVLTGTYTTTYAVLTVLCIASAVIIVSIYTKRCHALYRSQV